MYTDSMWNLSEDGITRRKFEDNIKIQHHSVCSAELQGTDMVLYLFMN